MQDNKWKRLEVFLEFFIFGVIMGIAEDIIAIYFATGAKITWHVVGIAALVAIPFAIIGEYIVDKTDFTIILKKYFGGKK